MIFSKRSDQFVYIKNFVYIKSERYKNQLLKLSDGKHDFALHDNSNSNNLNLENLNTTVRIPTS